MIAVAAFAAAAFACDVAEPDSSSAASAGDTVDAADTSEGGETEVEAPPSSGVEEQVVSLPGPAGEASDDLFPDLDGDDLVWTQLWFDANAPGADPEYDCMRCPYCDGCRIDVVYRKLPDGPLVVLDEGTTPRTGPRVGDGLACWRDDSGQIHVRDLDSGQQEDVVVPGYVQATPVPYGGKVWWWGYDQRYGYTILSYELETDLVRAEVTGYLRLQNNQLSPNSQLANIGYRQPFAVGDDGLVFIAWDGSSQVRLWPWAGDPIIRVTSAQRMFQHVLPRPDGALVTLSYRRDDGCNGSQCDLMIDAFADKELEPLAVDAVPTRFVEPAMADEAVVWVDYRDGPYTVYAVDADGRETRISSDLAEVGALSNVAADGQRVVWADRRSGRWRLVMGSLP